jgi:hypothetical protein
MWKLQRVGQNQSRDGAELLAIASFISVCPSEFVGQEALSKGSKNLRF